MNKRLEQFLSAENISQAQFADTIEVARASVSHVIAGRNKPGYDFIKSISEHYPRLSLDWLINGKGKMYKDTAASVQIPQSHEVIEDSLFKDDDDEPGTVPDTAPAATTQSPVNQAPAVKVTEPVEKQRNITKIVVFYNDNTYQELV